MITNQFPQIPYNEPHPLCTHGFHKSLEDSKSLGQRTGWYPQHLQLQNSILPGYIKTNSYGEYIFDWAWAEFYHKNHTEYYPKLLHALPFTPVNAPKFLNASFHQMKELAENSFEYYQNNNFSGEHYLFINDEEEKILNELGFQTLHSIQYHFQNEYDDFEHFLFSLKKNRRKMIKKERKKVSESNLEIKVFQHEDITSKLMKNFYEFYLMTINKKFSYDYLDGDFFKNIAHNLNDKTMITAAYKEDKIIAMALFFYSNDFLYGRNWGIDPNYEGDYPFLHFELCYYQGLDFCFQNKIKTFEAGAQGEHKLWRGFKPVIIKSAHHIKNNIFAPTIYQDIKYQNIRAIAQMNHLKQYLPFKSELN